MKLSILSVAMLSVMAGSALAQETPFEQPSVDYLSRFAKDGQKVFVYERYDAQGKLTDRQVTPLTGKVQSPDATRRIINGTEYRLRGLQSCPSPKVTYQTEEWDCRKAVQDYNDAIYNNRGRVTLCKTLALKSVPGKHDPVSCFTLVGKGIEGDVASVNYDDDYQVFSGFAAIRNNKEGKPLRPDLLHSKDLGKTMGLVPGDE